MNVPPKGTMARAFLEVGVRWRQLWREVGRLLVDWSQGKRGIWKDTP